MSLKVRDVMVKNVVTVPTETTVRNAAKLMNKHDIGCLVVMKKGEACWNSDRKGHAEKGFVKA